MDKQLWTVQKVSEYLNLAPITIYKYVSNRKMPFYKIGSAVRFRKEQIDDWIEKNEKKSLGRSK